MIVIGLTESAFDEERADIIAGGYDDFLRKLFRTEDIFDMTSKHTPIKYGYAEDDLGDLNKSKTNKPEVNDLKSAIRILPPKMMSRLVEGIELGDIQLLDEVILKIHDYDSLLAEALKLLANRFNYDQLLQLVQEPIDEQR